MANRFIGRSINQQRKERIKAWGLFAIIPLIGTAVGVSFVVSEIVEEIRLSPDRELIRKCEGKKDCPDRISALNRLVNAERNLRNINLRDADLRDAKLRDAKLNNAKLNNADLRDAKLNGTDLRDADLRSAFLRGTNLRGTNLSGADLSGAKNFTSVQIKSACNWDEAIYKGHYDKDKYEWIVDREANQQYIEQLKHDKASDPKEPVDCSRWK